MYHTRCEYKEIDVGMASITNTAFIYGILMLKLNKYFKKGDMQNFPSNTK